MNIYLFVTHDDRVGVNVPWVEVDGMRYPLRWTIGPGESVDGMDYAELRGYAEAGISLRFGDDMQLHPVIDGWPAQRSRSNTTTPM